MKTLSHDSRTQVRDLKPEHLKYEAGVLNIRPRLSVGWHLAGLSTKAVSSDETVGVWKRIARTESFV
jgi:hypothetical protein